MSQEANERQPPPIQHEGENAAASGQLILRDAVSDGQTNLSGGVGSSTITDDRLVVRDALSRALSAVSTELDDPNSSRPLPHMFCPTCFRPFPSYEGSGKDDVSHSGPHVSSAGPTSERPLLTFHQMLADRDLELRAPYFRMLPLPGDEGMSPTQEGVANELVEDPVVSDNVSQNNSTDTERRSQDEEKEPRPSAAQNNNTTSSGYYATYFVEVARIGHGSFGGVYVCRHVVEGHSLGLFAVKKVPIGDNAEYLAQVLREVKVLEEVRRHPNVIEYNHSWIDWAQVADFGPQVRCMFILMEYATEGSLETFMQKHGSLLSDTAVWYFFLSAVCGLGYLHSKGILHRDLKPQNLLLTKAANTEVATAAGDSPLSNGDGGGSPSPQKQQQQRVRKSRPPRLMVGDFGTSTLEPLQERSPDNRTGATGTQEFMAPELKETAPTTTTTPTAPTATTYLHTHTEASDMWGLGMILHYLAFEGVLPVADPVTGLIQSMGVYGDDSPYCGFCREGEAAGDVAAQKRKRKQTTSSSSASERTRLSHGSSYGLQQRPKGMLDLIRALLDPNPMQRPSCEMILNFPPAKKMIAAFESGDWHLADTLAASLARETSGKTLSWHDDDKSQSKATPALDGGGTLRKVPSTAEMFGSRTEIRRRRVLSLSPESGEAGTSSGGSGGHDDKPSPASPTTARFSTKFPPPATLTTTRRTSTQVEERDHHLLDEAQPPQPPLLDSSLGNLSLTLGNSTLPEGHQSQGRMRSSVGTSPLPSSHHTAAATTMVETDVLVSSSQQQQQLALLQQRDDEKSPNGGKSKGGSFLNAPIPLWVVLLFMLIWVFVHDVVWRNFSSSPTTASSILSEDL